MYRIPTQAGSLTHQWPANACKLKGMKTLSYSHNDFESLKSRFEDKDLRTLTDLCRELTAAVRELQNELKSAQAEIRSLKGRTNNF